MNQPPNQPINALFHEQMTVRLLNVYKGMPIANDATVTRVEANAICVNSIKAQIVCMFLDRQTFIQSPSLPQIFRASVLKFNTAQMEVWLGNFSPTKGSIGERKQVRVVPVDMLNSVVQPKNLRGSVKAELADISQNGMAIYLPRAFFTADVFKVGAEMVVHLTLPVSTSPAPMGGISSASGGADLTARFNRGSLRGTSELTSHGENDSDTRRDALSPYSNGKLVIRAQIRNVILEAAQSRVRIGMHLFPTLEAQAVISNFITQRQSELVREVRTLYEMLNKFDR